MIRVSVIIPVYGVEDFIGRCSESLLSQTIKEGVEFIFVDDACKDCSIERLKEVIAAHPERNGQIKILTHEVNRGLPAARNTGMAAAKGEYVYHFDGDDFADPAMLETMVTQAYRTDADYLWADWYLSYENTERLMPQPDAANRDEALSMMLQGRMKYNVWNKLVRRSVYTRAAIQFPEGYSMGEDMTMIRVLATARKVEKIHGAWYHYVKTNTGAMTGSFSERALADIMHNVDETAAFLKQNVPAIHDRYIDDFKLSIKYPFLFSEAKADYDRWQQLWPESNRKISRAAGLRPYLIQTCARLHLRPLLILHYRLYNAIYNKLYK